jgi:hypothetical protein
LAPGKRKNAFSFQALLTRALETQLPLAAMVLASKGISETSKGISETVTELRRKSP